MTEAMIRKLVPQPYPATGGSQYDAANSLFLRARSRARRGQIWSRLTGRSRALYPLKQFTAACAVQAQRDGAVRPVPIHQIRGSEGRSRYFDGDFNPLYDQARGRWLNIARARQQGKPLPPVVLVQVGDVYFVKDGHHRISVARAFGQRDIEARVTVWQVSNPPPWETPAGTDAGHPSALLRTGLRRCSAPVRKRLRALMGVWAPWQEQRPPERSTVLAGTGASHRGGCNAPIQMRGGFAVMVRR